MNALATALSETLDFLSKLRLTDPEKLLWRTASVVFAFAAFVWWWGAIALVITLGFDQTYGAAAVCVCTTFYVAAVWAWERPERVSARRGRRAR